LAPLRASIAIYSKAWQASQIFKAKVPYFSAACMQAKFLKQNFQFSAACMHIPHAAAMYSYSHVAKKAKYTIASYSAWLLCTEGQPLFPVAIAGYVHGAEINLGRLP